MIGVAAMRFSSPVQKWGIDIFLLSRMPSSSSVLLPFQVHPGWVALYDG
jgi:hypothetical protein